MIRIHVTIDNETVDTVEVWNTREKLNGQTLYGVKSLRNKPVVVAHDPRHGIHKLISHVFSHYCMVERNRDTPTTKEEW